MHILKFLEVDEQPFRVLRTVAITLQPGDVFTLTSDVPFTCSDMATGHRKMFQEGRAVPGSWTPFPGSRVLSAGQVRRQVRPDVA